MARFWKKITNLRQAADLLRQGHLLMQMHNTKSGLTWYIIGGGEVTEKLAAELLARPDVQPSGDALFPGISQTYKMRAVSKTDTVTAAT
jgi:hypothetical protein